MATHALFFHFPHLLGRGKRSYKGSRQVFFFLSALRAVMALTDPNRTLAVTWMGGRLKLLLLLLLFMLLVEEQDW